MSILKWDFKILKDPGRANQARATPPDILFFPIGQMGRHQRLEELAMVRNAQVQEFMGDDKILEAWLLVGKIHG